ncbi:MAG: J domain-containing protein [Chitinispirillaceae bacterium]|nr:J domain-containing protein [Chitinispirillaceae bacterium]
MKRIKPNQTLYDRLKAAREILGLTEEATMDEIRKAFHTRIRQWHPDKAAESAKALHDEKSREILEAYRTVMEYCACYKISFSRETINRYRPFEEAWWEQYGHDPMWGG